MSKYFLSTLFCLLLLSPKAQDLDKAKLANEYYQQSAYDKALDIYDELKNNKQAIPLIYSNYLDLLTSKDERKATEKFLNGALRHYPSNFQYKVSLYKFLRTTEQHDKKEKYFQSLMKDFGSNQYQLNLLAQNLANQQLTDEAVDVYKRAREVSKNPRAFALELAGVYAQRNEKGKMTEEYLNYAEENPRNLSYVKNLLQNLLSNDTDLNDLEDTLIKKIQQHPDKTMYAELLIWMEIQRKDFYAAFVQARALDKRLNRAGYESMKLDKCL